MQSVYSMLSSYQTGVNEYREESSKSEIVASLLKQSEKPTMAQNLKKLFCMPKTCIPFYKSMILFIVTFNLLYMSIFLITRSHGRVFVNFVIFGVGISSGGITSGILL
jgi:hypothetical protein